LDGGVAIVGNQSSYQHGHNHYWACWFVIGVACQCRYILLPSPPKLIEALLVVAMTVDYVASDAFPRADVQIFGKGR